MSEEANKTASPLAPETLQDRVDKAYIAKGYTLFNGGTDNILMIQGEKNETTADILMTFDGIKEMVDQLEPDTQPKEEKND
jgi:hypothetical protein